MIAAAREEPVPVGARFIEGDICRIDELVEGEFGGAICLGNALPHILETSALASLFSGLRSVLAAGAPLLIQLLNYERIFSRNERYLPLNFRSDGEEDIVFLRLMNLGDGGEVHFYPSTLRLAPGNDPPVEVKAAKEVRLKGWRIAELEALLVANGFSALRRLGDFAGSRFEPLESRDLLLVAR
jgi:hypothetical protein